VLKRCRRSGPLTIAARRETPSGSAPARTRTSTGVGCHLHRTDNRGASSWVVNLCLVVQATLRNNLIRWQLRRQCGVELIDVSVCSKRLWRTPQPSGGLTVTYTNQRVHRGNVRRTRPDCRLSFAFDHAGECPLSQQVRGGASHPVSARSSAGAHSAHLPGGLRRGAINSNGLQPSDQDF
jgi:hypothetical protein